MAAAIRAAPPGVRRGNGSRRHTRSGRSGRGRRVGVLTGLGFKPLGELGIPLRWAFKEPERLAGTNTYIVVTCSLSLRNHLAVRDILRADPDLRQQ